MGLNGRWEHEESQQDDAAVARPAMTHDAVPTIALKFVSYQVSGKPTSGIVEGIIALTPPPA